MFWGEQQAVVAFVAAACIFLKPMFVSALSSPALWQPFLTHPIFRESLAWIATHAASAEPGIYELGQPGWFVNVHGYTTKPEAECVWENHRQTIDIQYLIEGIEGIRLLPVASLGEPTLFKAESDTEKFAPPTEVGHLLALRPGEFAVFFPGEAHCPKIAIGEGAPLRKLVVKIPVRLIS
ncbi:MAG TPA: YhcH/YjgK/YiaL family protein [Chthoniobacterales bacterium]